MKLAYPGKGRYPDATFDSSLTNGDEGALVGVLASESIVERRLPSAQ